MDVWVPVVATLAGGLISALAGYLSGLAVWKREREAAREAREAEALEARTREQGELKRELLETFIAGRVALARWRALWGITDDPANGHLAEAEKFRNAASRLALLGELLAANIGTEQARKVAGELTDVALEKMFNEASEFLSDSNNWDSRGKQSRGTSVSMLVDRLLRFQPENMGPGGP